MSTALPAQFQPLPRRELVLQPAPEAEPQGVVAAVARHPRARAGVVVVVLLLAFAVLGPLLWQQDPAQQWLSQVSIGPTLAQQAVVVAPDEDWHPALTDAVSELRVIVANTEYVRLQWPSAASDGYRIYRSSHAEGEDLGILLAETAQPWYQDRLQLRAKPYRYTVVAAPRPGNELRFSTVVTPEIAISEFAAELQGLRSGAGAAVVGDDVTLPAHPLGTDGLGRDMLARLIQGARTSLFVGVVAPLLFIGFGAAYGALSGLVGGRLDNLLMRFADFVVALPFLLFMILLRVAFGIGPGESGILPLILALLLLSWPSSARLVRGQVLKLRREAFIDAARLAGAGHGYLILRHLLPNVLPVLLVALSFAIPQAIFAEAFLSFIGIGVSPPTASWGSLCNDGMKSLLVHPHELVFPALMISVAVLAFNLLGDALRDVVDVRLQGDARRMGR